MDSEKEARRKELQALRAAKQQENEYFQDLDLRAKMILAQDKVKREQEERVNAAKKQMTDPDLKGAEPIIEDPDDKLYFHKEAKKELDKEMELIKNKDYLDSLKPKVTKEPDFKNTMGKTTGAVMNQLTDKFSPLLTRNEEEGDYTPVNLMGEADASLRALKVVDNLTGRPLRRSIYETLGGEPKKEVEGSDIRQQLETKTGKLNDIIGTPLELAADFGLDWTNFIPVVGAAGVGRKLATKFAKSPEMLEHIASIAAKKAKDADVLKHSEDLYRAMKERPDAFRSAAGLPMDEESRIARAKRMGFDTDNLYYHGTNKSFNEFDPNKSGTLSSKNTSFVTSNPEFANIFTEKDNPGANILPLRIKNNNIFDYENPEHLKLLSKKLKPFKDFKGETIVPAEYIKDGYWTRIEDDNIQDAIRKLGFDGFYVNEAFNKNIGLYNPANIRSKFAEFNPSKIKSSDLLAGLAGATGVGATALSSSEANASEMKSPSRSDVLKILKGE